MTQAMRGRMVWGLILVLAGIYFLALQFFPALRVYSINTENWPLLVVGVGALFLLAALLTWTPGLMIPAAVVGGIGVLLFWQNATHNWTSWAYAWALIPGFSGVGILLMNLMQGDVRRALIAGGAPILISLAAFLIFASFFGALGMFGQYSPVLLILLGVIVLGQALVRRPQK